MKTDQAHIKDYTQELADEFYGLAAIIQKKTQRLNEIKKELSSLKAEGFIDGKIETDDFTLSFQAGKTTHIFPQNIVDAIDEAKSLGLTQKKQGPGFWKLYSKKPKT